METRTIIPQTTLLPEIWFQTLSFLSKRDLYTCYFVSHWMSELAHLNNLYSKAPAPWPKRNFRFFKDEQTSNTEEADSSEKTFEKNEALFDGIYHPNPNKSESTYIKALYKAYCKHKFKNISGEAIKALIPHLPYGYPAFKNGASQEYVLAEMNKKNFLLHVKTLQACYLGNKDQIIKIGCLSNNDFYLLKEHKKLNSYEIRYGWNSKKNEFEHNFVLPLDFHTSKLANFHADQLVTSYNIVSGNAEIKIGLFDFNMKTHRYINLKQGPRSDRFQGAGYNIYPLNEDHLIGFGNKWAIDSPAQPLWIWDNKTGELIYSKSFPDLIEYQIRELADGNLRISYGPNEENKLTLRFGLFNTFDQKEAQQAEKTPTTPALK